MPKHNIPKRTQPKPVSLYDPGGNVAYAIDSMAALAEYEKGVPVNRVTAVRQTMESAVRAKMADMGLDVFALEKIVIDWRTRHNL